MRNNFIKIFLIISFSLFSFYSTYANSGTMLKQENSERKVATIKELKTNIEDLDEKSIKIEEKKEILNEEIDISSFFNKKVNKKEYEEIENILANYKEITQEIEETILEKLDLNENIEDLKNKLVEERKGLFKALIIYIDDTKINEYLEYIKKDAEILKEKENIKEEIITSKSDLENKIKTIKEKIEEHKKEIDEKIDEKIKEKIDQKIESLKNSEKFKKLKDEQKLIIFDKIIEKVGENLNLLKEKGLNTNITEKKIEIYNIVIERIKEVKEKLEKDEND